MSHAAEAVQSSFTPINRAGQAVSVPASAKSGAAPKRDHLSALQAIGSIAHFARNATIFSEGDDANYFYRVVSGAVRLCKLMGDGRRQIADFLLPDDFFGFEWLKTYSLTAEALTDVVVVRYSRSRLDRLGEARHDVQESLMGALSRDLWAAQNHVVMLGRQSAKERLVSFILALVERVGAKNGDALELPMSRQDIADYLGLTIETVCRTISELKRARYIDVPNRSQITVRNIDALRDIADGEF